MTEPLPPKAYTQSSEADATHAGGRAVIFHRTTKHAITLNESGTLLWQKLEHPTTRNDLENLLKQTWPNIPEETAKADVATFLEQLLQHQLII